MSQRKSKERRRLEREMQERHIRENREWLSGMGSVEVKVPATPGFEAGTSVLRNEQAVTLLELGIIERDGEFFRAHDREAFNRALELNTQDAVCDFCTEGRPTWRYPCEDKPVLFDVQEDVVWHHTSIGAWFACETCAELIERDDRQGLVDHCARVLADLMGVTEPTERGMTGSMVANLQSAFWSGRRGERIAL